MPIPCQTVIKENGEVIQGTMDTTAKFHLMTAGIDLKGKTVLDVGCNSGMMCSLAHQAGALVKGVDVNRDYVKQAKEYFPSLDFQCEKAEELHGNYDIILASAMLHYTDIEKVIGQFSRCAKQVICDVWLHPSEVPIFALTTRGIYIPSMSAFLRVANKYFKKVELKGPSPSPDDSNRFIFHLSNPTPIQPEAILIYGLGESGKSTLSRTFFDHLILRTDDIFFVWKEAHIHLMLSVSFFSELIRGEGRVNYLKFCSTEISNWLAYRTNRDVVIEGYDLLFEDYKSKVIELLTSNNWKVMEISL